MGEFSDFFVCKEGEVLRAAAGACNSKKWPYWGCKWVAHFHLASLYALLTDIPKEQAIKELDPEMLDEPGAPEPDPDDPDSYLTGWAVSRFPEAFVRALAKVSEAERADLATRWKADLVAGGEKTMDCAFVLDGIAPLATKAVRAGHLLVMSQPCGA